MEPFHFESSGAELFGMYHPATQPNLRQGVVFCPPFGNELYRVYRPMSIVAQRWTDRAHVLQFDYFGTADSFGNWNEAGPSRWLDDISRAVEELSEISGASTITLAGVRLGALLAANAVLRTGATKLILWDPIVDGEQCRTELEKLHQELINLHPHLTASELIEIRSELCGFPRASWIDSELPKLVMPPSLPDDVEAVSIVQSGGQRSADALACAWSTVGRKVGVRQVDFQCDWDSDPEGILNPAPVIEELVQCL